MGIASRMVNIFKADIHGVMDQFEDRVLLLKQHLRDMAQTLNQKEADIAGKIARRKQIIHALLWISAYNAARRTRQRLDRHEIHRWIRGTERRDARIIGAAKDLFEELAEANASCLAWRRW